MFNYFLPMAVRQRRVYSAFLVSLFSVSAHTALAQRVQEIQIGEPKAWRYDRMYPELDGLLRDLAGTSIQQLSNMDPNALNAQVIQLIQSYLTVTGSFDQAAALSNGISLQQYNTTANAQLASSQSQAAATQQLFAEKASLTQALTTALSQQQSTSASLKPPTTCSGDPTCSGYQAQVLNLQSELSQVTTLLGSATPGVTAPTLATPAAPPTPTGGASAALTGSAFNTLMTTFCRTGLRVPSVRYLRGSSWTTSSRC